MSTPSEFSLTVPVELVRNTTGLSLDFGGSVLKAVYRSKDNKSETDAEDAKVGHLQLVSFSRKDWDKALDYIKDRAEITRDREQIPDIYTTGVGCTEYGKCICEKLAIQLKQLTEFDCFVNAFIYLASNLPRRELLETFQTQAAMEAITAMMAQMAIMKQMKTENLTRVDFDSNYVQFDPLVLTGQVVSESISSPLSEAEDIYPCLLAMCGSGFAYMQVNKDKTFKFIDASNRGGRALFGLGSLLTECESYSELIELASQGDSRNIDFFNSDFFAAECAGNAVAGDESMYAKTAGMEHGMLIYCFGKCGAPKRKEDFKREDLARSLLNFIVLDVVQCIHLASQLNGIRRVFFSGSFCNTDLVRKILTTEFARRNILASILSGQMAPPVQFDFLKPGAHLGAIGAMIGNLGE